MGSLADVALALYRKYRPAKFAEVVGQEHVTEPLRTALEAGRINHAYLFSGPRGCGKTSSARILARSLNCEQGPTAEPCGVCASCVSLAPGGPGNIDVTELDAASHGGVDDTRELRDRAFFAPAESRYRVFIVDEAHMITTQGFNALLKIVEEPPEHLVFVFATTEPDKVLPTIRSRTHHYPFRLIPPGTLRKLMERICAEEGAVVAPAVYPLVIRAGGGSARDSLSVLDQLLAGAGPEGVTYERAVALLGVTDVALIDDVVDALAAGDRAAVFEAVDRMVEAGHDPRRFASDLLQRLRDLTLLQAVPEAPARGLVDAADDEIVRMVEQADWIGAGTLARYAEIVHTGLIEMRGATAPRLLLELLCARMLLPAATVAEPGLLERLERLERRNAIAATPLPAGETGAEPAPAAGARRTFERPSSRPDAGGGQAAPAVELTGAGDAPQGRPDGGATRAPRAGADGSDATAEEPSAVRAPDSGLAGGGAVPRPGAGGQPERADSERAVPERADSERALPERADPERGAAGREGPAREVPGREVPGRGSAERGALVREGPAGGPDQATGGRGPATPDPAADGSAERRPTGPGSVDRQVAGAGSAERRTERPGPAERGRPEGSGGRGPGGGPGEPPAAGSGSTGRAGAEASGGRGPAGGSAERGPAERGPADRPAGRGSAARDRAVDARRAPSPPPERATPPPERPDPPPGAGLDAAAVRRVWPEILAAAKDRKKRTAALLVSATVRAVEGDTLVLSIGTAPLARLLSEQSNTDVIAESLHAVLGVRWRVRCEHGDAAAGPPPAPSRGAAPPSAAPHTPPPRRPSRPPPTRRAPAPDDGEPLPPEPPDDDTPPEDDEEAMLAEAAAGAGAGPVARRDPEEAAIELLTAQLGARAIDRG